MVKNKTSRTPTAAHKKPTKRQRKLSFLLGFCALALVLAIFAYLNYREDLGPQLAPPPSNALYKQSSQPTEARVKDLLARMTLEEKIGQMALVDKKGLGEIEDIGKYSLGGVLSGAGVKPEVNSPQGWRDMIDAMSDQAAQSRLGIPILYGVDANHGHANVMGATVFPHAIGLGASNDTKLVGEVAIATSQELAATGVNWNYSPSLDAPKDIRWGRVYEAFSDDPKLIGKLGSSYIQGTQKAPKGQTSVMATAKHYLATGGMEWDRSNHKDYRIDQGVTPVDNKALANEYLPPYKSAIDAGVSSIMVGLNKWGDERVIDSKYLLTNKLKRELDFNGFIVSDWYGVYEYAETNKYAANIKTINAGLDMAMLPYDYKLFLKDVRKAVNNGSISQSRIDDAVSRILTQKFNAGLFDKQKAAKSLDIVGSKEHRQLARKAVASSAVLLKNEASVLPLSKNSERILVAGSGANNIGRQSGAWTIEWQGVDGNWLPGATSILEGIRQTVANKDTVEYKQDGKFAANGTKTEVGVAIVSEKPYAEGWGDNEYPNIDAADVRAIKELRKSSQRVVVVIISGRPLLISDHIDTWDAAIAGWLPGSEGSGIADVLFGNQPFTAKLPITWPATIQQVPIQADGGTNDGTKPLFERGFGL